MGCGFIVHIGGRACSLAAFITMAHNIDRHFESGWPLHNWVRVNCHNIKNIRSAGIYI